MIESPYAVCRKVSQKKLGIRIPDFLPRPWPRRPVCPRVCLLNNLGLCFLFWRVRGLEQRSHSQLFVGSWRVGKHMKFSYRLSPQKNAHTHKHNIANNFRAFMDLKKTRRLLASWFLRSVCALEFCNISSFYKHSNLGMHYGLVCVCKFKWCYTNMFTFVLEKCMLLEIKFYWGKAWDLT